MSKGSGGIIIREEWNNTLVNMSISEKGIFLDSLLKHVDGEVISDIPEKMYYFIKSACDTIDMDRAKYKKVSEARSEAGRLGGEKSGEVRRQKVAGAESDTYEIPTLHDIETYAKCRKSNVIPRQFYEYYNAHEWKDRTGSPIRDWKKLFSTWEKEETSAQQERSYDIEQFAQLAMNRSFENCD